MRAAILNQPRSVPTGAIVRAVLACVCGSDLWPYRGDWPITPGRVLDDEHLDGGGRRCLSVRASTLRRLPV